MSETKANENEQQDDLLSNLPHHALVNIISKVEDGKDLKSLRLVSKRLKAISDREMVERVKQLTFYYFYPIDFLCKFYTKVTRVSIRISCSHYPDNAFERIISIVKNNLPMINELEIDGKCTEFVLELVANSFPHLKSISYTYYMDGQYCSTVFRK
ncbi:hypothetical protein B4U79_19035 [Dinothrombium tinctorium]|uniref:F-box domain-containing protein n=1 Tax=Dinothrombium tinctorium TaxID=1965070 RepID=A0A3S3QDJ4_9ACAR|nr:hypothetical protein B4U79_19055 [Dinothrombium tinctorium]RWS07115.1 hypothetical protein B4U79_19054 [Dinothrombium tinctorium]RWS07550.1 hypothetical protein B4U79_19047 [Dinothrombium tinctorium]RWS08394.1 hypothetical protein B4U79_19035 [Dinothrombium tinctorium]